MSPEALQQLYLDANIFIYAAEGVTPFADAMTSLFERIRSGEIVAHTSELTLAEVLVKPLREGRADLVTAYERILQSAAGLRLEPVNRAVWLAAARIRATTSLRLPDAVHLATAELTGCEIFLTNDRRLPTIKGLTITSLEHFA